MCRALVQRGYAVDRIDGGPHAAELALAGDYALVVLDLVLADGLDGRTVLKAVHEQRPDRKVFVVSARSTSAIRVECLDGGAVDFLTKPFDLGEFLARVDIRCVDRVAAGQRTQVSGRFFALDPLDRKVRRSGEWISLTHREYLLLAHLVASGEKVSTRQDLLAALWGITEDDGVNSHVEMYVHKLRRKLGRDAICTVRGSHVGYRINRGLGEHRGRGTG
jgi:DNA-binding response OmpR family regulator